MREQKGSGREAAQHYSRALRAALDVATVTTWRTIHDANDPSAYDFRMLYAHTLESAVDRISLSRKVISIFASDRSGENERRK